MGLTDHLTEEQRRQRIAKILLRGAFLLAKKEGWLAPRQQEGVAGHVRGTPDHKSISLPVESSG